MFNIITFDETTFIIGKADIRIVRISNNIIYTNFI